MRLLLIILMLLSVFPVHAGKLVIEPGKVGFFSEQIAFDSEEFTFSFTRGNLSYGRLDLSGGKKLMKNPHSSLFSLGLEARQSVKRGTRGIVYDTDFLDFSLGMGRYPEMDLAIEYGNLSLLLDIQHRNRQGKTVGGAWMNSIEMDIFTFGALASCDGFGIVSLISISPEAETRLFTGVNGTLQGMSLKLSRGDTLLDDRKKESSFDFRIHTELGNIWVSGSTGFPSRRPSSYRTLEREIGYGLKIGSLEIGRNTTVSLSPSGKWRRNASYYLDTGFSRFSFHNRKLRFQMESVYGLSIGVSGSGTSISFRYKGIEIRRMSTGIWSFRVSVEFS